MPELRHIPESQDTFCREGPLQGAPDPSGAGLAQCLTRSFVPLPQVREQAVSSTHTVQPPSTRGINVLDQRLQNIWFAFYQLCNLPDRTTHSELKGHCRLTLNLGERGWHST